MLVNLCEELDVEADVGDGTIVKEVGPIADEVEVSDPSSKIAVLIQLEMTSTMIARLELES
jgi:hypothetical protein